MIAAEQGLPVQAVGSMFPAPLASFIASGNSGIKSVADLKGKSVGYSGIPLFKAFTDTALKSAGLSGSNVTINNAGFNEVPALLSGKVSALTDAYRNDQAFDIQTKQGVKPLVIPVDKLGVPTYDELVITANSNRLVSDPHYRTAVKDFTGYYAALADAKKNPCGRRQGSGRGDPPWPAVLESRGSI